MTDYDSPEKRGQVLPFAKRLTAQGQIHWEGKLDPLPRFAT